MKKFDTETKKVLGDSNKTEKEIPFVATFHLGLKILQKIIEKNLYLLYMNEEVRKAFATKPISTG